MAKTAEDLEKSRSKRKEIVEKYDGVPTSIWKVTFAQNHLVWEPRVRQADVAFKDTSMTQELQDAFSTSGKSVRGKSGGQSIMPYDLWKRVVSFYSEKDEIVLDPCMGVNTAMTVANNLERHFIGYNISEEHFEINRQNKEKLEGKSEQLSLYDNPYRIEIYKQSSESMSQVPDATVDLVFFSPPYWDLEFYGEEEGQLGYGKTYPQFLEGLGRVINECYRVLKPGKFCTININDFRKGGRFYDYHADVINLMNQAGFIRHDSIIVAWPNCIGQCFASQVEERKVTAKAHEYLIVGRK